MNRHEQYGKMTSVKRVGGSSPPRRASSLRGQTAKSVPLKGIIVGAGSTPAGGTIYT